MDSAGLSDERAERSIAGHGLSGARERRGRNPRSSTVHTGPVNVRQGGAMPSLTVNRPAGDVEGPAAAAETADYLQAEYFMRLLAQSRRHSDHRIGEYQKAIAAADAAGDTEGASCLRRQARIEEQDRHTIDGLIENLHRRFPIRVPGGVSQVPRKARLAVR
jgi:hypothetical protein